MKKVYRGRNLEYIMMHMSVLDAGLNYKELMLYAMMMLFVDPYTGEGEYDTDTHLATMLGMKDPDTVSRYHKNLVSKGLIQIEKSRTKKSRSTFKMLPFTSGEKQHKRIDARVIVTRSLSLVEKAVYIMTMKFANYKTKEAFPSIDRVRELLSAGRTKVAKSYQHLESLGLISIRKQSTDKLRGNAVQNYYTMLDVDSADIEIINELDLRDDIAALMGVLDVNSSPSNLIDFVASQRRSEAQEALSQSIPTLSTDQVVDLLNAIENVSPVAVGKHQINSMLRFVIDQREGKIDITPNRVADVYLEALSYVN